MANAVTMQQLIDASLDTDALGTAVNGADNQDVKTRLNKTYPTLAKAIKTIMQKAPINSTPFATKSALLADTTLADGAFAFVHNDADANNGLYQKIAGGWQYQKNNLFVAANRITGFTVGGYNPSLVASLDRAYSPWQYNDTGANYTVTVQNNDSTNLQFLLNAYASVQTTIDQSAANWSQTASSSYTVTTASPYFIAMIRRVDGADITQADIDNVSFTFNSTVARTNNVNDKVAKLNTDLKNYKYTAIQPSVFELGSFSNGALIPSTYIARSQHAYYIYDSFAIVENSDPANIWVGVSVNSVNKNFNWNDVDTNYVRVAKQTFYVSPNKPYVKFIIRKADKSPITQADIVKVKISVPNRYTTEQYVDDAISYFANETFKQARLEPISSKQFELGTLSSAGALTDSLYIARSKKAYSGNFKIENSDPANIWVGTAYSANPNLVKWTEQDSWYYQTALVDGGTTVDSPYVKFLIRKVDKSNLTVDDIAKVKILTSDKYATIHDVDDAIADFKSSVYSVSSNAEVAAHTSTYRAVSKITGGLVSFIDDDGRDGVYNTLNPIFKNANAPFASAIVPMFINTAGYMTLAQLKEIVEKNPLFETMNHTFNHPFLTALSEADMHKAVHDAKRWLSNNGFYDDGFVLPYGNDNEIVRNVVAQYYDACYDFYDAARHIVYPTTIRNTLIQRANFGIQPNRLDEYKALIDTVAANNGWIVITTHVDNSGYWDANSAADLAALIDYIKTTSCKIVKPREGFQAMGNLLENDKGFRITATGETINRAW